MKNFNISREYLTLLETLKNDPLKPTGHFNYPLKCVFPARVEFLQSLGELKNISLDDCQELIAWKSGLQTKSLSVVFSSSYPNNPSSMFGHTLIRLKSENGSDILDYSVAFSAWQEATDSGFLLAVKGLIGGYRGLIELTKYYQKVNEYNYYESRDLIEYPMKINSPEVERFINHLWEIYQTTYFDYYFADENCSSILYRMFIVALKDRALPEEKRSYFLPRELVENLNQAGVLDLEKIHVRGSLKKHFLQKFSFLTVEEKNSFFKVKEVSLLTVDEISAYSAATLESAKDYFYYKKAREKGNLEITPLDENKRLHDILVARSLKNEKSSMYETVKDAVYPHFSHGPSQFNMGVQRSDQQEYLTFGFGIGFHDFTDSIKGNEAHQNFEILQSKFRINENEWRLQRFTLIDLKSLHPYTFYDPQASWAVEINYQDEFDQKKMNASFGGGLSFKVLKNWMYGFFILPALEYEVKKEIMSWRGNVLGFINFNHESDWNFHLEIRKALFKMNLIRDLAIVNARTEWTYQLNHSINVELKLERKLATEVYWSYHF